MARVRLELGPVPLHHQVYLDLRRALDAGEWAPGDQLPTERDLADQYGCSLITVRRAIERARSRRPHRADARSWHVRAPPAARSRHRGQRELQRRDAGPRPGLPRPGWSPPGPSRPSRSSPTPWAWRPARRPSTSSDSGLPAVSRTCSSRCTCRPSGSPACSRATWNMSRSTSAWPPATGPVSCARGRRSSPSSSGLGRHASSGSAAVPQPSSWRASPSPRTAARSSSAGPTSAAIVPATTSNVRSTGPSAAVAHDEAMAVRGGLSR